MFLRAFKGNQKEDRSHMAVGRNQWYHFGVGAPPIFVYLSGDWDVHGGILTHGHSSGSNLRTCPCGALALSESQALTCMSRAAIKTNPGG